MIIEKFSFGMGDRFAHQGKAQLQAVISAKAAGADIAPVWNKSHREHSIVGSEPQSLRDEADAAVAELGYTGNYYIDADHINLSTVDAFIGGSNFFTIDVADYIGQAPAAADLDAFVAKFGKYAGKLDIPGIERELAVSEAQIRDIAGKYLLAVQKAGEVYRHVANAKGEGNFVPEVSMDETDAPQTPVELFFILAAMAQTGIPAQTIAPKFTGRFNKGVDYEGDVAQFSQEFEEDLLVIAHAVREFGLPESLKLSVHSGSDKFSIYQPIRDAIKKHGAGLHIKTAGTTWLEEIIGLAEAGGEGLALAKDIYAQALSKMDALCAPYATVIKIDKAKLPTAESVYEWSSQDYVNALRHIESCPAYNPHLRQLLHVGFKIAAQKGETYLGALREYEAVVAKNVTENLLERHMRPLFL